MVRRKSRNASHIDDQVTQAVLGVQSGLYKSLYEAAKLLGLSRATICRRVGGGLSRSQARQEQQKLSGAQENTLLKWIKELTISGYSLDHRLLKEIAEELRTKRTYNLSDMSPPSQEPPPRFQLGQDWVPRFIQRHPYLKVVIGRRIESVRMDGATKEILGEWFDVYRSLIMKEKIEPENTYNIDESGFSIGTIESTR